MKTSDNTNSLLFIFNKIFYFLFSYEKKKILCLIILIMIAGLIPSIDGIILQKMTNFIASLEEEIKCEQMFMLILKWILTYMIWWESLNILWRIYDAVYLYTIPNIKATVIDELYYHILYHSHSFFQKNLAGDIVTRILEGSRSLEMIFAYANEKIIRKVSVLLFAFITIAYVNNVIAFIFFSWLILFLFISIYCSKYIYHYSTMYAKQRALLSGKILDSILNIGSIRMCSFYKFERNYLQQFLNQVTISDQNMQWFMFKLHYLLGLLCTILIGFIIYFTLNLKMKLILSIGDCILIMSICVSIVDDFWDLTQELGDLFEQIGCFSTSLLLVSQHSITDYKASRILTSNLNSIEYKNVYFEYKNKNFNLNINKLVIKHGQKIGLTGFSGSGKTTFINLLTRLFEVTHGSILINNENIKDFTQSSLRSYISIIPQEPLLFHRTIFENITYGNINISTNDVIHAAKSAYIHDFINSLPQKYNTVCGERGGDLSGGQRQRIIIARAILKQTPIIILDEATSALDAHTENLIQKSLRNLIINKTVLIISHRLSTLVDMDRILVFNNGVIVGDGTHEFLKKHNELYHLLYKYQYNIC